MLIEPQTNHAPLSPSRRLKMCRVRVRTLDGVTYRYHALALSTGNAALDALDYFGRCKIAVSLCALQGQERLS